MTFFHLPTDARPDVLRRVQSLEVGVWSAFAVSNALCDRIEASVSTYLAEEHGQADRADWVVQLRSLAQLLLADAPSIGLIRTHVARLPAPLIRQIEALALRLANQVPACSAVASSLVRWAKVAPATDLLPFLRPCVVEGGAVLLGRNRSSGRPSARHLEPIVFGRGRGVGGLPKLQGGRPADDAGVRLIANLAVDWHLATVLRPESGRDGYSAFSGLVYSVFGWLDLEAKAEHCLKQYWKLTKKKRPIRW